VESARTEIIDNLRPADYHDKGRLAFVELIGISKGVRLDGPPERDVIECELRTLAERQGWSVTERRAWPLVVELFPQSRMDGAGAVEAIEPPIEGAHEVEALLQ
jgi:hypothetical protein